jgi:ribosome-associated protein
MIRITSTIAIGESELRESYVRASGPGGQNVNKVATAVQLRFDAARSPAIGAALFQRLARLAGRRMTVSGEIVIIARRFRNRERNREDALERLIALIRKAAVAPRHRRPTKPSKGAKQRRLDSKRRQGIIKKTRGKVRGEGD